MNQVNSGNPKPQGHLHTAQILIATMASLISVVGGVYSLKSTFFQEKASLGGLSGQVTDERLARPLRLATVEIFDTDDGIVSTLSTDDEGLYTVEDLKEGNYRIKATAPRHEVQVKKAVIQNNRTSTINFNLAPMDEPEPSAYPHQAPVPEYETLYPDSSSPRQPSGTDLWVKTAAMMFQQMMEKKKKTG